MRLLGLLCHASRQPNAAGKLAPPNQRADHGDDDVQGRTRDGPSDGPSDGQTRRVRINPNRIDQQRPCDRTGQPDHHGGDQQQLHVADVLCGEVSAAEVEQ